MKNLSLGNRLFVRVITLFVAFALIFILFQHQREKNYKVSLVDDKLQTYNRLMYQSIDWSLILNEDQQIAREKILSDYMLNHPIEELRLTIVNKAGMVIFDSKTKDYGNMLNHLNRKEISEALKRGSGYDISRQSSTLKEDFFYSATYFQKQSIIIRSALPYNDYLVGQMKPNNFYIYLALVVMLLLVIILWQFSLRLGKNITKLKIFAERASENESLESSELLDFPKDELGQIAEKIISLYKNLRQTKQQQTILKYELTQNIAHELKTPVSCIQAYLETILTMDVDDKTKQSFIEKTYKQSQRLAALLQDISTLNRLDNNAVSNDFEMVNINDIISQILKETDLQLKEKQMNIKLSLPEKITIYGSNSLLYSVFQNLVSNAILYAGQGTTITIEAKKQSEQEYSFVFSDNGVGVKSEHLGRLFERFYRVDKGRSRKMGGTGLGLAIVKNAIETHGGKIQVTNNTTGGLRFDFTLKTNPMSFD